MPSLEEEAASWVLALFRHISLFTAACGRVTGRLEGVFGTAISAAAVALSEESRRTPCDRRAYFYRSRGPQLIFELQRRLRGKRENMSLSPSRFCLSRDLGPRKQTGPELAV